MAGIPPFGSPPTPDATASKKGKIQLAGDLTGTAASPVLVSIVAGATVGSSTQIPVITYNNKGQITASTTATPTASTQRTFSFFMG